MWFTSIFSLASSFMSKKSSILIDIILVGIIIFGAWYYVHTIKSKITVLELQVANKEILLQKKEVNIANLKLQEERLTNSITIQNTRISNLKIQSDKKQKVLVKWKQLPSKIKYKYITKIVKVKSNECKDIKNSINNIRHINFNELQ